MLFLIDSSAILNNFEFQFLPKNSYVTTSLIISELRDIRSKSLVENALHQGVLKIQEPKSTFSKKIELKVKEFGFEKLSEADKSLIALALEFKDSGKNFKVVSDDFSIQNFLSLFNIPFSDVIQGKIKEVIFFSKECPSCKRTFSNNFSDKSCPYCGTRLKSKPKKHS